MSSAPSAIVDCDLHPRAGGIAALFPYLSVAWREYYRASTFYAMSDREPPPAGAPSDTPAAFAEAYLERPGVDAGILVSIQSGAVNGLVDHIRAAAFVAAFNDYLVDCWLGADRRFWLAATVSPLDPATAAREIRRMSRQDKVVAIFLPLINRLLGSGHFEPIFAAAERADLPIILHPTPAEGTALGAPVLAGGLPANGQVRAVLAPEIAFSALASLVLDGAFARHRGLRVVFSDYGFEWVPAALWRLDSYWAAARTTFPHKSLRPSDVIRERVSFAGAAAIPAEESEQLWSLLRTAGLEDSILSGSDSPYGGVGMRPQTSSRNAARVFGPRLLDALSETA